MKASAPQVRMACSSYSMPYEVTAMILMLRVSGSALSSRIAATPSMPGSLRSISITAGRSLRASENDDPADASSSRLALELAHLGEEPLAPLHRGFPADIAQHDGKFFAAEPARQVIAAARLLDRLCERAQDHVPGFVPELVVEALEVVPIEHEHGERLTRALHPRDLTLERLLEKAPVVQPREVVADGLVPQGIPQFEVRERQRELVGEHGCQAKPVVLIRGMGRSECHVNQP